MTDINRKVFLMVLLCLFISCFSHAQIKGNYNYLDFANKSYYFGMALGIRSSQFKVIHSRHFIRNDSINSVESPKQPGFSLSMISNLKIGKYIDLRVSPTFALSDRQLMYKTIESPDNVVKKSTNGAFLEIPIHVRYKSKPYNDIRVFVVGGLKYSFDFASNFRTIQSANLIKVTPSDFSIEYGAGFQVFLQYFIFSPEIKVSHGISNLLISNNDLEFSSVLDKLLSRTFSLSFHFEG